MRTALVTTSFLLALGSATAARALSADELIAKNIEARGGRAKLAAIQSLRLSGQVVLGEGDDVWKMSYAQMRKRPGRLRIESSIQGLTSVTAFDGETGWTLRPFGGRRDPDKMPPDEVKSIQAAADLDGPLLDYQAKGHKVEYLGTEDVDGTDAHKLQVTLANGDIEVHFLDPDQFLTIRVLERVKVRGVEDVTETDYGNYERVNGAYIPFSIESGPKGGPKYSKVILEKTEANVPLDDAQFRFPEKAAGENKR